jgi:hypothetical protein
MNSPGQLFLQIVLYLGIFALFASMIASIVRSRSRTGRWAGLFVVLLFLENVVTFPAALFGYERYRWLLGHPSTTLYLWIVLTGLSTTCGATWIYLKFAPLPRFLTDLPPLRINESVVFGASYSLSIAGAVIGVALSASGYMGYYIDTDLLYDAPTWLGVARVFLNICLALGFVVYLSAYTRHGRLRAQEWLLVAAWTFAGIAWAFKTYVILSSIFVMLAAWLTQRLRLSHVALCIATVFLAYAVVEPMRQMRMETNYDALESLAAVMSGTGARTSDNTGVLERVMNRIDYTVTGVESLEADRDGRLARYRARLDESYSLLPLLAFVPGALWPDKPLADHGRDLSIALSGIETNSVTPSHAVASYLWLGFFGVFLNSAIVAYFGVMAGRLLERYSARPMPYLPVFFLVLVLSFTGTIMAYHYISILRAAAGFGLFYAAAYIFGFVSPEPARPARSKHFARARR